MARRRSYRRPRTRYIYGRARRAYRSRRSFLSGKLGKMLLGAGLGFASQYVPNVIGKWTKPALFMGAGFVTKKQDLLTIGAYELGKSFTTTMSIGNPGGFWE